MIARYREQHLAGGHGGEDLAETAELQGNHDDDGEGGDVDQNVFHDGDRGGRTQSARVGERGEHAEGDDERQVGRETASGHPERPDHDLDAEELQGDVGERRDDARDGDCERQPPVAESASYEVGRRDVAVLVADVPEPREHQKQQRIDQNGVGNGKERHRARAEGERRDGDEGVGGIDVAADQKPRDDGAEPSAAEAPLVQKVEVALAPPGGGEAEPGDQAEQQNEDDQRSPVYLRHPTPSRTLGPESSPGCPVHHGREHGADDDPEELKPVEERQPDI